MTYYGKTKHVNVRAHKNLRISALTGKRVKVDDDSAIKEHILLSNQLLNFEDFSNEFKVTLIESLRTIRVQSPLNKNKQSLPSELLDS